MAPHTWLKRVRRRAFSIIEVIVAMTILGISMTAIFAAIATTSRAAHHARMQTEAVLLAESLLTEATLAPSRSYSTRAGAHEAFTWQVQTGQTPVEELGFVKVTVHWQEQQRDQEYELISFVQMQSFGH